MGIRLLFKMRFLGAGFTVLEFGSGVGVLSDDEELWGFCADCAWLVGLVVAYKTKETNKQGFKQCLFLFSELDLMGVMPSK